MPAAEWGKAVEGAIVDAWGYTAKARSSAKKFMGERSPLRALMGDSVELFGHEIGKKYVAGAGVAAGGAGLYGLHRRTGQSSGAQGLPGSQNQNMF